MGVCNCSVCCAFLYAPSSIAIILMGEERADCFALQTDIILQDFSKAFDKVNHSKLLWKLHQYGIRGHVFDWVRAFLGSRSQRVVIDGEGMGIHTGYIRCSPGLCPGTDSFPDLYK